MIISLSGKYNHLHKIKYVLSSVLLMAGFPRFYGDFLAQIAKLIVEGAVRRENDMFLQNSPIFE